MLEIGNSLQSRRWFLLSRNMKQIDPYSPFSRERGHEQARSQPPGQEEGRGMSVTGPGSLFLMVHQLDETRIDLLNLLEGLGARGKPHHHHPVTQSLGNIYGLFAQANALIG